MENNPLLDKQQCRRAFNQAAKKYDDAAVLQRQVGTQLIERLDLISMTPQTILDVGAGTGTCAIELARRYPKAKVIALDVAANMLQKARGKLTWFDKILGHRQHFICGDAESLPVADHSIDLLFSNLTLQWCNDLQKTFSEFHRVLKSDGLLQFSSMGPDTLKELRSSWQAVDSNHHVHPFIDMHDLGDALMQSRFACPVMDMETVTLSYTDVMSLMRDLKTLGAHNSLFARSNGLTGKKQLRAMIDAYEQHRRDGVLPASYEVVYGHAWAPTKTINVSMPTRHLIK
jgi:malonyl-CoA O-methyltransferase